MEQRRRVGLLVRHRPGHGAQRQIGLGALALLLPQVYAADRGPRRASPAGVESFQEYAGESVKHSFWARAYYEQQRAKGKTHQAAAGALAYKWIRIIWKCWQTSTPYNEVKYLDRKSTRLNSSHRCISYAVFCLKKKK